jgi:preprotein translocase SecF subunit
MKLQVIKKSKLFLIISLVVILIGLVMIPIRGLNVGIDFSGGTLLQIELNERIEVSEIREITDSFDPSASIVHAGLNQTQVIIKTTLDMESPERYEVFSQFKERYQLTEEAFLHQQKFEPSIGQEIQNRALISVLIAAIGILIYITLRFEWQFGLSAVAALLHDVLIGIAVYSILRIPINSSFIAAMLTIVGYSINDTIVVFDRIRENMKSMHKVPFEEIIDTSISQTIVRSINTSMTTLFAITALYVFGVEAIREFALPLIVGILAGTYSSIFIASPIWYRLKIRKSRINYYNPNKASK